MVGIAVDVRGEKVDWSCWPYDGALKCASLEGSDVEVRVECPSGPGTYADQLVVDSETGPFTYG